LPRCALSDIAGNGAGNAGFRIPNENAPKLKFNRGGLLGMAANRWEVYADDEVICSTPCTKWVDPSRPVLLRAREESFFAAPDKVQVPSLVAESVHAPLQLKAHGTAGGQLTAGITFLTFTGLAVVTGITLTALSCSTDRSGFCTGGLIALGAGVLGTVGGVWLLLDALPKAEVMPQGGRGFSLSPA